MLALGRALGDLLVAFEHFRVVLLLPLLVGQFDFALDFLKGLVEHASELRLQVVDVLLVAVDFLVFFFQHFLGVVLDLLLAPSQVGNDVVVLVRKRLQVTRLLH